MIPERRAGAGVAADALIFVRNPCVHDSRVLRQARALRRCGFQPRVVGVVSDRELDREAIVEGVRVERLTPGSPLSWARGRLRRGRDRAVARSSAEPGPLPGAGGRGALGSVAVRLHRWIRTLDFYRQGIRVVRAERPALVHCNDYNTMWIGVGARLLGTATVVYDAHELWPDRNLRPEPRWWLLACEALFVRCAHRTITASPGYADVMARRYRIERPVVIRNVPERSADGKHREADPALIVYAGAVTRNRGLEVAIDALARLPRARLQVLGPSNPAYRAELEQRATGVGVADRVELAGAVPPGEVVERIAGAGVGLALIQPSCLSYSLSLPNKLFEYVAAGVPVLASDLPVIGEFVRDRAVGLLARPGDPADAAAKLSEMIDPERNRSLRSEVRARAAEISWETEAHALASIYGDAAGPIRSSE